MIKHVKNFERVVFSHYPCFKTQKSLVVVRLNCRLKSAESPGVVRYYQDYFDSKEDL